MDCIGCAQSSPSLICETCEEHGWTERPCGCVLDPNLEDVIRCDNCNEAAWVDQQERDFRSYHGGTAPQAWYDATEAVKARRSA